MVASDGQLYLFDTAVAGPELLQPSLVRAARLDLSEGTWSRLPDSSILQTGPWLVSDHKLVNPSLGSVDGNGTWGQRYQFGGIFDTDSSTWTTLPNLPPSETYAGVIDRQDGVYVSPEGWVLDLETSRWTELPPRPDGHAVVQLETISAGRQLVIAGGASFGADATTLFTDVWVWTP
jgi:hypothetical protein